jgi:hypothetical protein
MAFKIFISICEYRIISAYAELKFIANLTIHLELSRIKVILLPSRVDW